MIKSSSRSSSSCPGARRQRGCPPTASPRDPERTEDEEKDEGQEDGEEGANYAVQAEGCRLRGAG
eukprot:5225588-Pyramimonas_sp.AAC.2